jgi:hypothetical protein
MHLPESQLPRGPIIQSFRTQILERHEAARRADSLLREQILANLEQKRQTGLLIEQCKSSLRGSEFREATDFLSNQAVREYIRFASHNSAPVANDFAAAIHNIKTALRLTNALPFTSHGPQELHDPNFFSTAARQLMCFLSSFRRFIRATPIATWDRDTAEMFLFSLKPILEIYADVKRHVSGK